MFSKKLKMLKIIVFLLIYNFTFSQKDREINLFEISNNSSLKTSIFKNGIQGEILSLNKEKLKELIESNLESFNLKIPLENNTIELKLKKSSFIVEGALAKSMYGKFRTPLEGRGTYYWGNTIDTNLGNTIIAFSFFKDRVVGLFSSDIGDYALFQLDEKSNNYAFYKNVNSNSGFECGTSDLTVSSRNEITSVNRNSNLSTLNYPLEISMNANNCTIFNPNMGNGSVQQTIDLILSDFNIYALIFANEEISIKISEIVLEDSIPPNGTFAGDCGNGSVFSDFYGPGMTTSQGCTGETTHFLQQFQNIIGSNYVGDYAYMYIGGRSCYAAGRAATTNGNNGAFCNLDKKYRMAVGRTATVFTANSNFELPDFFSRLEIFPHEIGHLLGSPHTSCSNSMTTFPFYNFTPYYNIMLSGGGNCFNIDNNFRRGFGVEPGNHIRNNILNNISCFDESSYCNPEDIYIFHRIEDLASVDYSAYYNAQNIVADNLILNNSEAIYKAESSIELVPGFEVEINSEFEASIELCNQSSSSSNSSDEVNYLNRVNLFTVYPTYVKNSTNIVSIRNSNLINTITVYNLFGLKVMEEETINITNVTLDLSSLQQGIYIIKVFNNKKQVVHTQKIIKE